MVTFSYFVVCILAKDDGHACFSFLKLAPSSPFIDYFAITLYVLYVFLTETEKKNQLQNSIIFQSFTSTGKLELICCYVFHPEERQILNYQTIFYLTFKRSKLDGKQIKMISKFPRQNTKELRNFHVPSRITCSRDGEFLSRPKAFFFTSRWPPKLTGIYFLWQCYGRFSAKI